MKQTIKIRGREYWRSAAEIEADKRADASHDWFVPKFIGYECCRRCGIVRRADRNNKPCKGQVGIVLK